MSRPFLFVSIVMAALVAAIHVLSRVEDVDPRNKSGDDGEGESLGLPEGLPSEISRNRGCSACVWAPHVSSQHLRGSRAFLKPRDRVMTQWVYTFGDGKAEGQAGMKNLLGGKGANLAEMSNLGLPVPPGFTITTEVCTYYYDHGRAYPADLEAQVGEALAQVGRLTGRTFGDPDNPLLVSVRSGARASMPGMMDTVLNLGLNDATVLGLGQSSGDERFAWDSYRRFIQMYSNVVLDVGHHYFEEALELKKEDLGVQMDTDLKSDDWRSIVGSYKKIVEKRTGKPFPQEPREQLWGAIGAVFSSWMNQRAITYRRLHAIPESWGTAVNVQAMVFGNMGEDCATGVAFTRH